MQLLALDAGKWVMAAEAQRHKHYQCPECGQRVFLREGPHRQAHYYHTLRSAHCRQNGKSLYHLQVQWHLCYLFPLGEAVLERPFPSIHRIADLFWEKEGIVFEIQCSPLSEEEAQARSRDYRSLDLKVVWVLHDRRFNKNNLPSAEQWLRGALPCYYTNISAKGAGICYDQFDVVEGAFRLFKGPPLPVAFQYFGKMQEERPLTRKYWDLSFRGDLIDQWRFADRFARESMARLGALKRDRFLRRARGKLKIFCNPSRWKALLQQGYEALLDACIRSLSDHMF